MALEGYWRDFWDGYPAYGSLRADLIAKSVRGLAGSGAFAAMLRAVWREQRSFRENLPRVEDATPAIAFLALRSCRKWVSDEALTELGARWAKAYLRSEPEPSWWRAPLSGSERQAEKYLRAVTMASGASLEESVRTDLPGLVTSMAALLQWPVERCTRVLEGLLRKMAAGVVELYGETTLVEGRQPLGVAGPSAETLWSVEKRERIVQFMLANSVIQDHEADEVRLYLEIRVRLTDGKGWAAAAGKALGKPPNTVVQRFKRVTARLRAVLAAQGLSAAQLLEL